MFLTATLERNRRLVEVAAALHRRGEIPPNTYVVDLDGVERNAQVLAERARAHGLVLYFVSKQFGRNPAVIEAVARHIPAATAIDVDEAEVLVRAGARLGNVGHLVQIPEASVRRVVEWGPDVITVFSLEKARSVHAAARALGVVQPVLLRVVAEADWFHAGQEGGVALADLPAAADRIGELEGVRIEGVTSFPCLRFDARTRRFERTPNFETLSAARRILEGRGFAVKHVNAPSGTCAATIPFLARSGATHGEPGHALTGTTPLHAIDLDQPEIPAIVYVSEVSHVLPGGRPAVIGGGFYARGRVERACLVRDAGEPVVVGVEAAPPDAIDYYRTLERPPHPVRVGDTAVFAFRTQAFVARARIAVVSGLHEEHPAVVGLFDPRGRGLHP